MGTKLRIKDGSLGLGAADGSQDVLLLGTCTLGTANVPVSIVGSDKAAELLGFGPLAAAAAYIADRGGATVWCVPVTPSGAGSMGTWSTSPTTGPAVGNTGTPNDAYQVWVKITAAGAVGTAKARLSRDGGETWEPEFTTAATYPLTELGITLTFAAGTYVLNEVYKSTATPPAYTSTELIAALAAWRASGQFAAAWLDVGVPASAAAGATIAGAIASQADTAEDRGDFVAVLLQAADDTLGNLTTAYAAVASKRELIAATFCRLQGADGHVLRRPVSWVAMAELAKRPISEDISRVRTGPIPGVKSIEHDEENSPGYSAAKFVTLTKRRGKSGFYVYDPVMRSPTGSDYDLLQMRRVMDVACTAALGALGDYQSDTLQTQPNDPDNPAIGGTLDPRQASAIDTEVQAAVTKAVVAEKHASGSQARVVRTDKVVSTRKLRVDITVSSQAWAKDIEGTIGYAVPNG